MVRKILLLLVSCMMVLSLVIASCGGGEEGPDDGDEPEPQDTADVPKYGGTFNRIALSEYANIDYAAGRTIQHHDAARIVRL